MVYVGLALMEEEDFLQAALPLLESSLVDAVEWTVDKGFHGRSVAKWVAPLLDAFAAQGRLYGHGVQLSLFSAGREGEQKEWREGLRAECHARSYRHISEHFGFMTAGDFWEGAPLPLPRNETTLRLGHRQLKALRDAAGGAPVGLENLALALCRDDVLDQGEWLDELLAPIDGFLLLDLHNLYCQAFNFEVPADALLSRYPLHRVREIHVSGGSLSYPSADLQSRGFRRDTHDQLIPEEVFTLLDQAAPRCPNLEVVVLERLGGTLRRAADRELFQNEFRRLRTVVGRLASAPSRPRPPDSPGRPLPVGPDEAQLARFQSAFLNALEAATSPQQVRLALDEDPNLAGFEGYTRNWENRCIEVAAELVRKWGRRRVPAT